MKLGYEFIIDKLNLVLFYNDDWMLKSIQYEFVFLLIGNLDLNFVKILFIELNDGYLLNHEHNTSK